jgi:hypothetical protein
MFCYRAVRLETSPDITRQQPYCFQYKICTQMHIHTFLMFECKRHVTNTFAQRKTNVPAAYNNHTNKCIILAFNSMMMMY